MGRLWLSALKLLSLSCSPLLWPWPSPRPPPQSEPQVVAILAAVDLAGVAACFQVEIGAAADRADLLFLKNTLL